MSSFKETLSEIGKEMLNGARDSVQSHVEKQVYQERVNCIAKATLALKEAGIDREAIIRLLQKYWDLRASEAEDFADWEPSN